MTRFLLAFVLLPALLGATVAALGGCASHKRDAEKANAALQDEARKIAIQNEVTAKVLAGIKSTASAAYAQWDAFISDPTATTMPSAEDTRATFGTIRDQAATGERATAVVKTSVPKLQRAGDKLEDATRKASEDLKKERDHWIGYKGRWAIGIGVALWLVLGIGGGVVRAMFGGGLFSIAEHVLDFLPASNLFYAGSDRLARRVSR